jgi:hypothetical protein
MMFHALMLGGIGPVPGGSMRNAFYARMIPRQPRKILSALGLIAPIHAGGLDASLLYARALERPAGTIEAEAGDFLSARMPMEIRLAIRSMRHPVFHNLPAKRHWHQRGHVTKLIKTSEVPSSGTNPRLRTPNVFNNNGALRFFSDTDAGIKKCI